MNVSFILCKHFYFLFFETVVYVNMLSLVFSSLELYVALLWSCFGSETQYLGGSWMVTNVSKSVQKPTFKNARLS